MSVGRRASGAGGVVSRSIAAAVAQLRSARQWDNQTLYTAADMSESYYYVRMRGDQPFSLNDLEKLASALEIHWLELCRIAAALSREYENSAELPFRANPAELSSRLRRVIEGLRSNGTAYSWKDLATLAEQEGVPLSEEQFLALVEGKEAVTVSSLVPSLLASFWDVPEAYFSDFDDDGASDMTEALLDFRDAMQKSGAVSIAARTLNDITPAALRAITRTLRSIS